MSHFDYLLVVHASISPRHLRFPCKLLGSIFKLHFADESEEDDEKDNTNIAEEISPLSDDNEDDSNNDSEVCRIS